MTRIFTVPDRIKLFKEINRVHKEVYGWKFLYENALYGAGRIDIESDVRFDSYHKEWVPMGRSEAGKYYFYNNKGKDITSLRGIFSWQAYHFPHLNPYKRHESGKLVVEDLGKKIRPNVGHPVECLKTMIEVQQRKEDGRIWISSNWIYHTDFYETVAEFGNAISETLSEAAGGDEKIYGELRKKYEDIIWENGCEFEKALERYFSRGELNAKSWHGGYLFTASKEWRIKTLDQFNEAIKEEEKHFSKALEEFIEWFRSNGFSLGESAEESLRRRMRNSYAYNPRNIVKRWSELLVEEDKAKPSDVYLWWGGEPNGDSCYALLALFFEVDPDDIGSPRFDEKVSKNLRVIINIAEKDTTWLSNYSVYEPNIWKVIFS